MKKRLAAVVAFAMSAALAVPAFSGTLVSLPSDETEAAGAEAAGDGKTVTVAIPEAWDTLKPLDTNSNYSRFISDQIYDRLIQEDSTGVYQPRLATSWDVSDDSTKVTFHLADNVTWQDGEPFTADDVVFSFQTYSDPKVDLLSRYYLANIDGVDDSGAETGEDSIGVVADDDHTVTVTMKSAMYADTLLANLNMVFIIPRHIYGEMSEEELNTPEAWENPVGTGPFIYKDEVNGERMELTANKDYFQGAPDFDDLVIRVVDSSSLLASLMSGESDVNVYGSIPLTDWDMAQEQDNLTAESVPTTSYTTFIMNESKEYMTEKVREAINMAIDRETLVQAFLKGQGQVIYSPFSPLSPYYDESVKVDYDPDQAKKILEEENFPFDQELSFLVPASGNNDQLAALIVQNLQAVGLKVKVTQVDFSTLMDQMRDGDFDFGTIGSGGTMDPSESREMIAQESSVNFAHVSDDTLSGMVDKANAALTFEERQPLFNDYQAEIVKESPMAYLFTKNSLVAYNKRLSGLNTQNFANMNWSIWTWKVAE